MTNPNITPPPSPTPQEHQSYDFNSASAADPSRLLRTGEVSRHTGGYDPANNYINSMAPPTDAQIANAAKYGFDLSKQEKYYSKEQWAARNNR